MTPAPAWKSAAKVAPAPVGVLELAPETRGHRVAKTKSEPRKSTGEPEAQKKAPGRAAKRAVDPAPEGASATLASASSAAKKTTAKKATAKKAVAKKAVARA